MQHSVHAVHGAGVITTEGCCPKAPALLRLTGDCVTQSNLYAVRAEVHGTMSFDGKSVVAVDFQAILRSSQLPPSLGMWIRSSATHHTWRKATKQTFPTRDLDLMVYLCPSILTSQFTQHFPTHLHNLGPVSLGGVPAWHLRDRVAVTNGGMQGTVLQSDFYLARTSLYWLRYTSLDQQGPVNQRVVANYSRFNRPVTISAPTIGSSLP